MKDKLIPFLIVCYASSPLTLWGAPTYGGYEPQERTAAIREMRDSIDLIRHELTNHETELRMFEERVSNQEDAFSTIRQQLLDAQSSQRGSVYGVEGKLLQIETAHQTLVSDLKKLKDHANESSAAISQTKSKLVSIEKQLETQMSSLNSLQDAVKSIMEALQIKDPSSKSAQHNGATKKYKIKTGDTLEKIAKAHQTTTQVLKELNHLSSDRIVVNQTLEVPQ